MRHAELPSDRGSCGGNETGARAAVAFLARSTRMRRVLRGARLATCALLIACGGNDAPPTGSSNPPPAPLSAVARAYLNEMVDVMQRGSINRRRIDWPAFRAKVLEAGGSAQSIAETYPAVRVALAALADDHSFYVTAGGSFISASTKSCFAPPVGGRPPLPATIGYVRVPSFSGSAVEATALAAALQDSIRANDRDDLAGWIVDLRGNGGGNMWPMVAGVGPVLGDGIAGHFIDPDDVVTTWAYQNGAALLNGSALQTVAVPYMLRRPSPRVAVLTDLAVASSGEAVAISFRKRPDARSFGTATCGLSTANAGYVLSDGATLILTVAVMADRTRATYGAPVAPDEVIANPGALVQRAVEWLVAGTSGGRVYDR